LLLCLGNPENIKEFREYFRKHERSMLLKEIEIAYLKRIASVDFGWGKNESCIAKSVKL